MLACVVILNIRYSVLSFLSLSRWFPGRSSAVAAGNGEESVPMLMLNHSETAQEAPAASRVHRRTSSSADRTAARLLEMGASSISSGEFSFSIRYLPKRNTFKLATTASPYSKIPQRKNIAA